MKTIVAGTRTIIVHKMVEHAIKLSGFKITELVSGGCQAKLIANHALNMFASHANIINAFRSYAARRTDTHTVIIIACIQQRLMTLHCRRNKQYAINKSNCVLNCYRMAVTLVKRSSSRIGAH